MSHTFPRRPDWLLAASLFASVLIGNGRAARGAPRGRCGPPVELVVAAALDRAGLDREQPRSWRTRLRWSALLPRLSGSLGESRATGIIVDGSAASALDLNNYLALRWQVRATWDLSRLLFDQRELRVAARAQKDASERQKLLERVVRLYFERCHLLLKESPPAASPEQRLSQALEVQRLTALLDGMSGGAFSGARWP